MRIPILLSMLLLTVVGHAQNFVWGHSPPPVAPGGIVIVSVTTNYLATTGTSLPTTIPATTAGNALVICSAAWHSHISGCTTNGVSAGSGFQITTNTPIGVSPTLTYIEGDYIKNIGAAITSVGLTSTADGSGNGFTTVTIYEISGLSTTAPYTATERAASGTGGTGNISTQDSGGQISNGTANSIYFALCESDGTSIIDTINASGTDGAWIESANTRNDGSVSINFSTVYQIVSSSSARRHVWNRVNNAKGTVGLEFVLHQ